MYDRELCRQVLQQIENAAAKVESRFQAVREAADFTNTPAGAEKMDAICMMLIVVGESLKNLDKITKGDLLKKYPEVDWQKAKGMRDIITHHYTEIDAETVFFTCRRKIPALLATVRKIIDDLEETAPRQGK